MILNQDAGKLTVLPETKLGVSAASQSQSVPARNYVVTLAFHDDRSILMIAFDYKTINLKKIGSFEIY